MSGCKKLLNLAWCGLISCHGALASEASVGEPALDELETMGLASDLTPELPLVVSASRLTQSVLHSPSAVTVLDKNLIAASGFTEIADLLRLVPGFQVARVNGRLFAVNPHGGGWEYSNRIQVLVNGRSTYTPSLSVVDWDTLGVHIDDIERIEVVRGPSPSAYGSNSFAAAVNIISKPAQLDAQYSVQTRLGNNREQEVAFKLSQQLGLMDYRFSAWHRSNSGFKNSSDDRRIGNLSFNGRVNLEAGAMDINLSYYDGHTGSDDDVLLKPRNRYLNGWSGHVSWKQHLSSRDELAMNFYYNYRDESDLTETIELAPLFGLSPAALAAITGTADQTVDYGISVHESQRYDAEVQYSHSSDGGVQYIIGLGLRQDTLISPIYFSHGRQLTDFSYRLSANLELPLNASWTINGGLIYEDNELSEGKWSPRLSFNWNLSELQTLRLAATQAYRIPSLLEANFDARSALDNGFVLDERFRSSENLEPENLVSWELAYLGQAQSLALSWELKAYHENYRDLINYSRDFSVNDFIGDYVRRLSNTSSYKASGIEGELNFRPNAKDFIRFHFNWGKSKSRYTTTLNPSDYREKTNLAPRIGFGVLAAKQWQQWQFAAGWYFNDGFEWSSAGDEIKAISRLDINISRRWDLASNQELLLKFGAQSLNGRYHEFTDDIEVEPQYYLNLRWSAH